MGKAVLVVSILILVSAGAYYYLSSEGESNIDFVEAQRADLIQEVNVTGRVKAVRESELGFEKGGRISQISARVGDKVNRGTLLLTLDHSDLDAQLSQAEAKIRVEEAKLRELLAGTRPEEIRVQEVKVANAEKAMSDSGKNLEDVLNDSFTKVDDAVRNKVDQLFSNPRTNPQFNHPLYDGNLKTRVEAGRQAAEKILSEWSLQDALVRLNQIKNFLADVSLAVNSLMTNANLTQTILDGYKADVFTARINVNASISSILAAEEELGDSRSALDLAREELTLKLAGAEPNKLAAQEAILEEARANATNISAQIEKSILRAPFAGTVSKNDARPGEIISAGSKILSLISEDEFEIEANLPEVDVAKVDLGDTADVTLDAYGIGVNFPAEVVFVDPAETVLEGVSTYKTTLQFLEKDTRIRSGMTANIDILTDSRSGVLTVPQRAIIERGGETVVRILRVDGSIEERKVVPGLRGSDGNTEIASGISEGERVVIFIRE